MEDFIFGENFKKPEVGAGAGLIISTKEILNLKSNFKSFGIVLLSFLIIAFLSISFVMSRMNMLPVNQIS